MEKYSVKKPFTVLVAVIAVLVLGIVSATGMTTDLLPEMNLPYLMVITTYPGASPEKVESVVSAPMESALGTVSHVKNVMSISAENYSVVQLEFEDGTDMDSAMVRVSGVMQQVSGALPDECGQPSMVEISMDMLATMYVAVSREGMDIYALSDYISDRIIPYIERQEGVANVSGVGLVEKSVQVDLNRHKIDRLNDKILDKTVSGLDEAGAQLDEALRQVEEGEKELARQEASFGDLVSQGIIGQMAEPAENAQFDMQVALIDVLNQMDDLETQMEEAFDKADSVSDIFSGYRDAMAAAGEQISENAGLALQHLNEAVLAYQNAREAYTYARKKIREAGRQATASQEEALDLALQAMRDAQEDLDKARAEFEEAFSMTIEDAGAAAETLRRANLEYRFRKVIARFREVAEKMTGDTILGMSAGAEQIRQIIPEILSVLREIMESSLSELPDESDAGQAMNEFRYQVGLLYQGLEGIPGMLDMVGSGVSGLTQGQLDAALGFSEAQRQLAEGRAKLTEAQRQYNSMREQALANANMDQLLSVSTLSQLIYAQNFAMPAGYIENENGESWLLKVGSPYGDVSELSDALLADVAEIGTIRLSDIADITVIDNAGDSYTRLNGKPAVAIAIYKSSTAGTNLVSRNCHDAFRELEESEEGLAIVDLMDQGSYITLIVSDILKSMLTGALLAIIVLALFLKDIRPTLIVGISIPLSVLFTMVLMYFSNLTLNIMTLSGLSLGIGMLVDNSIVVMENIIRLRARGISAARSAVQGAKQVSGSIIASTLTTICVFFPMVFTTGTVRQLLLSMALSITYCLTASLIVALTVVPASASTILRRSNMKPNRFFERMQEGYGRHLGWVLRHKAMMLTAAVGALIFCIYVLYRMGIVLLPQMSGNTLQITITADDGLTKEESFDAVDRFTQRLVDVDGIENLGIMDQSSGSGLLGSFGAASEGLSGSFMGYGTVRSDLGVNEVPMVVDEILSCGEGLPLTVSASTNAMGDLSSFMSSGLTVNVYGLEMDRIRDISAEVMEIVGEVEGFENISNGSENDQPSYQLSIDRDAVMAKGMTVAQIYMAIAERLTTSVTSTSLTMDGLSMNVVIRDISDPLTRSNLLDMEFTAPEQNMGGMDVSAFGDLAEMFGMDPDAAGPNPEEGETAAGGGGSTVFTLADIASVEETTAPGSIDRENQTRYISVTAGTMQGYNTTLLSRQLETKLAEYRKTLPQGYTVELGGETLQVDDMIEQMIKLLLLALLFIYLVMVAQFQSLLSPFIIMFTIPLAFTGGMLGLIVAGEQLSMLSLMGFLVLMGTVVNNGIVFVDYTNQLRIGGLERHDALIATGQTRMRPILMTAMTTILAMVQMIFGDGLGSQMGRGMAIVIAGGLTYATLMTLYIIPIMYDILYKKKPLSVDVGDDIDDVPDDAAEFIEQTLAEGRPEIPDGDGWYDDPDGDESIFGGENGPDEGYAGDDPEGERDYSVEELESIFEGMDGEDD